MNKLKPVLKVMYKTVINHHPSFFVLEIIKTLISIIMPFLGTIISPLIVDELIGDRDIKTLLVYTGILVGGELILSTIQGRVGQSLDLLKDKLNNVFSTEMIKKSMQLDYQLTEDKDALDQIGKARTGMSGYSGGAHGIFEQVFDFIGNAIKVVGFTTIIAVYAPWLILVVVVYSVVNWLIISKRNKVQFAAYVKAAKNNRQFDYYAFQIVDYRLGKDIRMYDASDMMVEKWKKISNEQASTWRWQAGRYHCLDLIVETTGFIRSLLTYGYSGVLAIRGAFSIGTFTQMISAAGALDNTLGGLVKNIQELKMRCEYAYEYVVFMEYPQVMTKGTKHIEKQGHRIEFKDVSFAYPGTDRKILDGVNLVVEPGEHLSIVGLNGAGKTTMIKLLCRLYDTTGGQILVDGVDIREYDYDEYQKQIAPVFQDFRLLGFTVDDNIAFDDASTDRAEKLDKVLEEAGMGEAIKRYPSGKDTYLYRFFSRKGITPSGGEEQKMAIARALYKDAPIVILDEPTAALDPIAEYEIYSHFNTLVGGKTAFYISHRLSSCKFCDHIAVFSNAKIAEYGTHDELVKMTDGIYAKMFEAQAQYYR